MATPASDPVEAVASKQAEWRSLSSLEKIALLKEILKTMSALTMDDLVEIYGIPQATMVGFSQETVEGRAGATLSAFIYAACVGGAIRKYLLAYEIHAGIKPHPTFPATSTVSGYTVLQTLPVLGMDKIGPFSKCKAEVWLNKVDGEVKTFDLDTFLASAPLNKAMVVLGAGNHCFLSAIDSLHGLFHDNTVVYLKHHPLRGSHDVVIRRIMQPLIARGYFDTDVDRGIARCKEIVHHPSVARVHLTGGKATHDAIVWGGPQRKTPVLKAEMTSELGCVSPWLIADQSWTQKEMDHQVHQLMESVCDNAGANCNSPKIVMIPREWEHSEEFVSRLKENMASRAVPIAYYPGSKDRWTKYRKEYPKATEIGDASDEARVERKLRRDAVLLPWLVVEGIEVDLSTDAGRKKAGQEYAFRNEPFCPVVTIVRVKDLAEAVDLSNNYLYGALSCTLIAPNDAAPDVLKAVADLRYGTIAINAYAGFAYVATGMVWGAYPGETLDKVESGIGFVNNCCFVQNIEKSVLRTNMVDDAVHPKHIYREGDIREMRATGNFLLKPSIYGLFNLLFAATTGLELPPFPVFAAVSVAAIGFAAQRWWRSS